MECQPRLFNQRTNLRLGLRDDDTQSLHADGEPREAFDELGGEQPDRLSLVGVPRGRCVVLVPMVKLKTSDC